MKMLRAICPKLPMRSKTATKDYYVGKLGFSIVGSADYDAYLMVQKDNVEIHFFEFNELDPLKNYGQVYIRTVDIDALHRSFIDRQIAIHPQGHLKDQPWGQREFSLLDPDHNLLTFGESIR